MPVLPVAVALIAPFVAVEAGVITAGPFQVTGVFTGLTPTSHNITAKDANGCTATSTFLVTSVGCPTITVNATTTNTAGPTATTGSITASATGGATPYMYSLNGGTFQSAVLFLGVRCAQLFQTLEACYDLLYPCIITSRLERSLITPQSSHSAI